MITEKIENKDLSQTVEVTQKSDEIAEEAVNHAVQEHQSVDRQFEAIERKAAEREAQLRRNAAMPPAPAASGIQLKPTPPPLAAPSALDDQVSEVRLNSMWESYCTAVPKAVECKVEGKP